MADDYAQGLLACVGHQPRRMNFLVVARGQFRHVLADEFALTVEFLRLGYRVEDTEPRLGIAAGGGCPLPAAVVGGEVEVDEFLCEVSLPPASVHEQVFYQKAGGYHAQAIVHVPALVELSHRGIDQRIAGTAFAPGVK